MERIHAFILAAGYGERLRPLTDHIPKPLLPLCGRPVIETVLDRISLLSPDIVCINAHHKSEQIEAWRRKLATSWNIRLFHEESILGTGGALKNAASLLRDSVFIVHNADILSNIDLESLLKRHLDSDNIATLAVHDYTKFNNVRIDKEGFVTSVETMNNKGEGQGLSPVAFMGIAVYSPAILQYLPDGRSSVTDAWLSSIAAGQAIGTVDFSGYLWTDIGTPEAYADAVFDSLRKDGETIYIHPSVDCSKAELDGFVVIEEGVAIEARSILRNCIVLPGAKVVEDTELEDVITGPDYALPISSPQYRNAIDLTPAVRQWLGMHDTQSPAVNIGSGGSDRAYYRICHKDRSFVLMKCSDADQDYTRHIAYTRFFRNCSLPVPDIFVAEETAKQALFEDLGDLSLYSWLKCSRSPEQIESIYKNVLDSVIQLQTAAFQRIAECPLLLERVFDYEHLRWETAYFMERFIRGIKEIYDPAPELCSEFDRLARNVATFTKTLVHRDFQSQNIMIQYGCIPRLIDYQGARIGPAAYDVASLLWDPYYCLDDQMRQRLLDYYLTRIKHSEPAFREEEFLASLLPCRLQRHMQALGAYGFLAKKKGKTYFLKYVPQAVAYLREETALARDAYPALYALAEHL